MSKRTKLQKEYYKEFGNYKGNGKYSDDYVKWLESKVLAINCAKQIMQEYHKSELISKVAPIIKSLQVLRINVYSGQSAFDNEKDIHSIELKLDKLLGINYNCTTCNVEINYKGVCEMCYTELKLNDLD